MRPQSATDHTSQSRGVLLLFSLLGLVSLVFLSDGFWGIADRPWQLLAVVLGGLGFAVGAILLNRLQVTATVGLTLFSVVLGSILAEILVRTCILEPALPGNESEFRNTISSNWPHAIADSKEDGVFRILGVSDSFGVVGLERNYHWVLERLLNQRGSRVEIVNFSVCGFEPNEELTLVRRFASRYHPDLVLHGLYMGNDLQHVKVDADRVFVFKMPLLRFSGYRIFRPWSFLIFRWARWQAKAVPGVAVRVWERMNGLPTSAATEEEFLQMERQNLMSCQKGASDRMSWAVVLDQIHQIQDEARALGAAYAIVLHPDQCQIDSRVFARVVERYGMDRNEFDLWLPQRYLMQDCEQRGVPCLDLAPAFQQHGEGGGLYNFRDIHWNEAGNRLAAECIAEFLEKEGMVPTTGTVPSSIQP